MSLSPRDLKYPLKPPKNLSTSFFSPSCRLSYATLDRWEGRDWATQILTIQCKFHRQACRAITIDRHCWQRILLAKLFSCYQKLCRWLVDSCLVLSFHGLSHNVQESSANSIMICQKESHIKLWQVYIHLDYDTVPSAIWGSFYNAYAFNQCILCARETNSLLIHNNPAQLLKVSFSI